VRSALPKKIRKKVSRRSVIRRLADKGYTPQKKIQKSDPGIKLAAKRISFGRRYEGLDGAGWKEECQGVADVKEFTWYPKEMKPTFAKLRAPWTYMTKKEKRLPAFVRPKRWFPRKTYKKVRKQKVFGLTTSNGKALSFLVPKPWSTELWAQQVKKHVAPFLKKCFPRRASFTILLDGDPLLHGPAARRQFQESNIKPLPGWPKYSPDLNPQENVWAWAEPALRKREKDLDTFEQFQKKVLSTVGDYPAKHKLVPSLAGRCKQVNLRRGAMLDK